jgi:hypothetical protein
LTVLAGGGLFKASINGALAQLVERLHGMQEVVGSSPIGSTTFTADFLNRGSVEFFIAER